MYVIVVGMNYVDDIIPCITIERDSIEWDILGASTIFQRLPAKSVGFHRHVALKPEVESW